MRQAPIDELLKRCGSIYKLVVVAARRAKELAEGAPKLIEGDLKKVTSIALEEIHQGKILYKAQEEDGEAGERKAKPRARAVAKVGGKKKS